MQNLTSIKTRLASSNIATPIPVIDLSLADIGTIEFDSVYVGRIVSARLINPSSQERSAKIDISIELLDDTGTRLGVLHDYLHLSPRSMRRLKEFLMSCGLVNEENYKTYELNVPSFIGKLIGLRTKESTTMIQDDGSPLIEVATYFDPAEAAEQYASETGKGQD
jgi:hypothetical protein